MFNNISWQGYWVSIALLTAGYYLVIYLLYFRRDFTIEWSKGVSPKEKGPFSSVFSDRMDTQHDTLNQPGLFDNPEEFQRPEKDSVESAVYSCIDEVKAYLEAAKKSKCIKEEILYALQAILRKYPSIASSEYKESLTNVLINQCEYLCSVHLSADDVAQVWVGR